MAILSIQITPGIEVLHYVTALPDPTLCSRRDPPLLPSAENFHVPILRALPAAGHVIGRGVNRHTDRDVERLANHPVWQVEIVGPQAEPQKGALAFAATLQRIGYVAAASRALRNVKPPA